MLNQLSQGAQWHRVCPAAQSALAAGASALSNGLSAYTGAVSAIASGAQALDANSSSLMTGFTLEQKYIIQTPTVATGGNTLTNGLTSLSATFLSTLSDSLIKANQQLSLVSVNSI